MSRLKETVLVLADAYPYPETIIHSLMNECTKIYGMQALSKAIVIMDFALQSTIPVKESFLLQFWLDEEKRALGFS